MLRKLLLSSLLAIAFWPAAAQEPAEPSPAPPGAPAEPGAPPDPQPEGAEPVGKPLVSPAKTPAPMPPPEVKSDEPPRVVRVNVTNQPWDFSRPWGKHPPYSRRAIGAVLPGGRVLVSAEMVANANYLEFEMPEGGQKTPASIEVVDYECNLAVLKGDDEKFLAGFQPFELTEAKPGDVLAIWQLENTGVVLGIEGPMTTAEVSAYPVDDSPLLVYRASAALQFRDSSFNLPVIKDGKLAGMVVRYDNASNAAEIVPAPVIEHFLKDAEQRPYQGFPEMGIGFSDTRDPQLRRYVGLNGEQSGGVYLSHVRKGGPGDAGGIKPGDVLLSIDGYAVDQDGNYVDPTYGKLSVAHLVSTKHFDGDPLKLSIFRDGKAQDLTVKISHRPVQDYVIEPYVIDRAPKFYMLGGLVLQELSRQYLKEFGNEWQKRAPEDLVYLDRFQSDIFEGQRKKIIILGRVLPMPSILGYDELRQLVVTKINGMELESLDDVPKALEKARNGIHRIEFDRDPGVIFVDAQAIAADEAELIKNYRLPATQRLEE